MHAAAHQISDPVQTVFAYHRRTKHSLVRYAAGPETLDWDAQPNPFREYAGCQRTLLPFGAADLATSFGDLFIPGARTPEPLSLRAIGLLMELAFALSAWKEYGPDRWALRCNPSSGNLHPTEAYLVTQNVPGLVDGVHHYVSRDHALELRCRYDAPPADDAAPRLWVALSSIHWREAWKYGERAFRYCQLDLGHGLGALRYAASALGWGARIVEGLSTPALAGLMGLDRAEDFINAEREDADLLIAIVPAFAHGSNQGGPPAARDGAWMGQANLLDPHPLYRWPVIEDVARASQGQSTQSPAGLPVEIQSLAGTSRERAASIILNRRSAQRFNSKYMMNTEVFYGLLERLSGDAGAPFDIWSHPAWLHLVLFVHRVEGIEPGLYVLARNNAALETLRAALHHDFSWQILHDAPAHLPFFRLSQGDCRTAARTICCHQFIASDACFALAMVSEFEAAISANPWHYRQLHWEAGLIGQVLYLEAEAAGLRGTGIGCFFDDALHELLGLTGERFQSLYHFIVGQPLLDTRITTLPPYPQRQGDASKE